MILLLLKTRFRRFVNSFGKMNPSNILTYTLVILAFLAGGYFLFYNLFKLLSPVEMIGRVISDKVITYAFFVFMLLLIMSNGITALSTLYSSEELDYLHSTPLDPSNIFTLKLLETTFYSSWATLVGAIPLIFSYLKVFTDFRIEILLVFIPLFGFLLIPSGIGVTIIILLKKINPKWSVKQLAVFLGVFSLLLIFVYLRTTPYTFRIPQNISPEAIYDFVRGFKVSNPYFPNEWFYKSLSGLTENGLSDFFENSIKLLASGLISISLSFLFANLFYRASWMDSETGSHKNLIKKNLLAVRMSPFPAMLQKDLKIFLRSPLQWSQLMIIGILLIIYTFSLRRTPLYVKDPFWLSALALINTGFIGYITATLSLRFVFPQISLEGRAWWILKSSPISPEIILNSKSVFFLGVNFLIAETVVILSNLILVKFWLIIILSAILVGIFSIVSIILSISLGTVFADFSETNPARIASGAGGLFTAALNFIYIVLAILIFAGPISMHIRSSLQGNSVSVKIPLIISSVIFLILTLLFTLIPLRIARKKIREL